MIGIGFLKSLSFRAFVSSVVVALNVSPAIADDFENPFSDLGPVVSLIETIRALPTLSQTHLFQRPTNANAHSQISTWIEFEFSSCAKREFSVEEATEKEFMLVKILDKNPRDCSAFPKLRKYRLNLAKSRIAVERVLVLNPTAPILQKLPQ